jgi:hypothetical protein
MAGSLEFIKSASGSSVSELSVTDCFTDKYDVYAISLKDFYQTGTSTRNMYIRFISSAGTRTGANYDFANLASTSFAAFGELKNTNQTAIQSWFYDVDLDEQGAGGIFYIYNPYDSSSYTFLQGQSVSYNNGNGGQGTKGIGVYKIAEEITGINFTISGDSIEGIEVSVYGVK